MKHFKSILICFILFLSTTTLYSQEDPYLWLEEVDGEKALEFVEEQNQLTLEKLKKIEEYDAIYDKCLEIYNSSDKIVYPRIYGQYVYNFWKDGDHIRGIWRRSPKSEFLEGSPQWETLLDLDQMSKDDDIKWVYKGASGLYPSYDRFLVRLSKGGGDAVVTREFDPNTKSFVEEGYFIEESKGGSSFIDKNTLLISSDFGENTMTSSGYPRQVKIWKRDTELRDAKLIYECEPEDVSAGGYVLRDGSNSYIMLYKYKTIFTSETFVWHKDQAVKLDIPEDANIQALMNNQLVLDLKSDWEVDGKPFSRGSIIGLDFEKLIQGEKMAQLILLPDEFSSVSGISKTENNLIVNLLKNVSSELHVYSFESGKWVSKKVDAPEFGTISVIATDEFSDQYFFEFENFLTPSTVFFGGCK